MGNRTLKGVLTQFVIFEIIWSFSVIVFFLLLVNLSVSSNLVYPANYPETKVADIRDKLEAKSLTITEIPNFYEIQLEDKTGHIQATTIPKKNQEYVEKAKKEGSAQSASFFGSKKFLHLQGKTQNLILSYQIMSDFVSPKLRKNLPTAELLFYAISLLVWLVGFLLIIGYSARKVSKELKKISQTNDQIRQTNLSFDVPKSGILEVNQVLESLTVMKNELSASLQEQWTIQKAQENTLQALTHDIRTPITLITGNLELLEETSMTEEQNELLANLDKGVIRLSQYVEELKNLSGLKSVDVKKEMISNQLIANWIGLVKGLAAKKSIQINVQKQENSSMLIPASEITKAFQNIIQNAIDYSPQNTVIHLSFEDLPMEYQLVVTDSGAGFSSEALKNGTERFYTSSSDRGSGHFGLGLSIVSEIMAKNNGMLELSNEWRNDMIVGGKVILRLKKSL